MPSRTYDRAYFDKWYRSPRYRVKSPNDRRREVALALAAADLVLGRPARSVLDVGCGEGQWRAELRRRRPGIRYYGVDGSEYVVKRFGRRRNIRLGSIERLDAVRLPARFDLIACVGVLNYLTPEQFRHGAEHIARRLEGVAYLEIFTNEDGVTGDFSSSDARSPTWYRRILGEAGLIACGMHCYAPRAANLAVLERA
jgi:SAM-dependent methyltransferase